MMVVNRGKISKPQEREKSGEQQTLDMSDLRPKA